MFHGATVSQAEATELRKITNVIRKGRVKRVGTNEVAFANESISVSNNTLFIDCSARAVPVTESYPVFKGNTICVQTVRSYQPVFSAGFIAHIEANYDDEALKNDICGLVPLPNHDVDWLIGMAAQMRNQQRWSQEPGLREWLVKSRLDGFTALTVPTENTPPEHLQVLMGMKEAVPAAAEGLKRLMPEAMATKAKLGI